jgi:hypothetical protein
MDSYHRKFYDTVAIPHEVAGFGLFLHAVACAVWCCSARCCDHGCESCDSDILAGIFAGNVDIKAFFGFCEGPLSCDLSPLASDLIAL